MSSYTHYLGVLVAGLLFVGIIVVSERIVPATTTPVPAASKLTIIFPDRPTEAQSAVLEAPIASPSREKAQTEETPTIAPVSPKKAPGTLPAKSTPVVPVAVAPAPAVAATTGVPLELVSNTLRGALVNIICAAPASAGLHSMSGSGIIIDPKGIILTNAHIAQYLLLVDRGVSCVIRTGSPAVARYTPSLLYISPSWVRANARVITEATPEGTGEYDFALVAIAASVEGDTLPAVFPSIPLGQSVVLPGTPVSIASFGAQFLESSQIRSSLFPTVVYGSVKDVYTFETNSIDVIALGGSAAAQEGSSGGGVADASGTLVGTITTSTITGETSARSLSAITASYIRSEYARETGTTLESLLNQSVDTSVNAFASRISGLEALITANLP